MNTKNYKFNFKKKLILGMAQFGYPYGINNTRKKRISIKNINKVFEFFIKNDLNQVDTAEGYGVNWNNLKKFNLKIDTKIIINKKNLNEDKFLHLIDKYKINQKNLINIIYIHNPEKLFSAYGKKTFSLLKKLKKKKIFNKIGITIYDLHLLKKIVKNFKFDVVQIPYSILDRRFETYFKILKKKKILIFVRSIFLQGTLISEQKNYISQSPEVKSFKYFINKYKINPKHACIQFVLENKLVDKIIVGVDHYKQLREILDYSYDEKLKKLKDLSSSNLKIIDPRFWTN